MISPCLSKRNELTLTSAGEGLSLKISPVLDYALTANIPWQKPRNTTSIPAFFARNLACDERTPLGPKFIEMPL